MRSKRLHDVRTPGWCAAFVFLFSFVSLGGFGLSRVLAQSFYEGKTVKIIVPFNPGGGSDLLARLLARFMSKHIPGSPSVIVQNVPAAGGLVAMNTLYNISKPDGLTVGHTNIGGGLRDQLIGVKGVKYDYTKFKYLGSAGPSLQLFVIRADRPYRTFEDLKKAQKTLFVAGGSPGSTSSVVGRILNREGANVKAVPGYGGSAPRERAVLAGEADATTVTDRRVLPIKDRVRPIFWIASKGQEWVDLPTMEELPFSSVTRAFIKAITRPLALSRTFLAPPGTPEDRMQILRKAFENTVKSSEFLGVTKKSGFPISWLSTEETRAQHLEVLAISGDALAAFKEVMGVS